MNKSDLLYLILIQNNHFAFFF